MRNSFKVFITGIWIYIFSLSFLFSSANNIRINGTVQVSQGTGDTLVLSFPLRWDNSWQDQLNWDAAWIFFKYKSGTGGWNHVNLCAGGHRFMDDSGQPVPFSYMTGNTGSSTVGFFVYRNTLEAGNTPEITCQIKCLKSSLGGLTAEQFQKHDGFILAQAVEMVYVPYGAYYVGDGSCANRFASPNKNPVLIDNEDAITAAAVTKVCPVTNNVTGSAQNIAAAYPKGYKGFYMMKYEVSQEQWVYFLNTLTYAQQQERVPGLSGLKSGEYIVGSKSEPSNRNGIIVAEPSESGSTVTFANNLHNDDKYAQDDDGKNIACNYLSPSDMAVYCSWSGLRPMSELEYEKACRQSYPEPAVPDEYAWHDNNISGRLDAVSNGGMRNERSNTVNANINAGNSFGPVRCGLFATGTSTQQSAGVAFWGGMELSGNLKEMCYNLAYSGFNGSTMGTGDYNMSLWSITPAHFGVRGGGFSSADDLLRVSDRTEAYNYFTTIEQRDSTVGFRVGRTIGNEVVITQGALIAKQNGTTITGTACPDIQLNLTTDIPAKVISGSNKVANMDISYVWYVLKPGEIADSIIPSANQAILSYNDLKVVGTAASVTYKFRRKAICPIGESITDYTTFTVPNMNIILSSTDVNIDACDNSTTVTASGYCNSPVYTWKYGDKWSKAGTTYAPGRSDFSGAGNFTVDVTVSSGGCTSEKKDLKISIPNIQAVVSDAVTMDNCGGVLAIDNRDRKHYCTVKVGNQCWMGKNMDAGTYEVANSDYWKFDEEGIQKWCYSNNEANCTKYGGLYEWWETVCNGKCNNNVNTSNALSIHLTNESQLAYYGAQMVPGSTTQVQGICPDGWHLPSDGDWVILETYLGIANAGSTMDWRGTDQGTRMKFPGTYEGYDWCSGATCNSSGFGALPGGARDYHGGNFLLSGDYGMWLTTTAYESSSYNSVWTRGLEFNKSTINRSTWGHSRSYGFSVRCVKN